MKSTRRIYCTQCAIRMPSSMNFKRFSSTAVNPQWRKSFEQLSKTKNITDQDWYKLDLNDLDEQTSLIVRKQFNGSMYQALSRVFPETDWHPWKFRQQAKVPLGFWKTSANHRKYFDDLGKKIGIQTLDDWYDKLSQEVLKQNSGGGLLFRFKQSPVAALMSAYPEHNWIPWKFRKMHRGYFKDVANQRKFFDALGKEHGIQRLDDWYEKLSVNLVAQTAGALVNIYRGSAINAIMAAYPEHNWIPWKFKCAPMGYWTNQTNQRKFFEDLGKKLGIQNPEDWYDKLSVNVVKENGGMGLLSQNNRSPSEALMRAFPEHKWHPWKFNTVPKETWNSKENIGQFLTHLSEKLSIQTLDDWYRVDKVMLVQFGAGSLLTKYKGLYPLLKIHYPHHPWDPKRFQFSAEKKGQRWLAVTLKKIFPDEEILEDYLHPKAVYESSKRPMQLDIFIPSRSLAFEYQGKQHYEEVGVFSRSSTYQQRDEEKRALCAANNIKLIEVPYWWNRTQEELQELMQSHKLL